jgi:O-acetylserine/cysteine efflux transporter
MRQERGRGGPAWGAGAAVIAMAGVNVIWGAAFPLTKPALEDIPPFTFALLRFCLALAVLLPLAGARALALLRGPDRRQIVLMGALGFCVAQLAQTLALELSPASDISLIATTSPLWIALLARTWLGERVGGRGWAGFALAILGLGLIFWPQGDGGTFGWQRPVGNAIFLVNGFAWACYNVLGKELMARRDPLPAIAAAGLVGTAGLVPFAVGEWLFGRTPQLTVVGVAAVAYTGLLVTVLGFLVLFWAYRRASAAQVAITMYLQPLAGVLLAWQLLGEPLGALFLLGSALVLAGVTLVTGAGRH